MSPSQLKSVLDVPRTLHLKFCPNQVSNSGDKTKVESVQLGKPPTKPRVLRNVCVVVEVPEII